ncbi:MAG: aromatic ring-hydroxylating dioxygenase subunit alpha [Saprospiraceae bacterium]|nr:aromatic ring-hydroxylating dioxygenase subunit alpha [Saprospiraceae bacterium]
MAKFYINPDISKARTIDKAVYLDAAVFENFRSKVFPGTWQFVGTQEQIANTGDITPCSFLEGFIDEPLVIAHTGEKEFSCLSNVCTHRGNILVDKACSAPNGLICKYHGRRFMLDGKMKSMPEFKEVKDFPSDEDHLMAFPLSTWGNWLFASLENTFSIEDYFGPMMSRLHWLPIHLFEHRPELGKDYTIHANWALYCENYLEGFHIPFVHEGLNAVLDFGSYETITEGRTVLQIGYAKDKEACFDLPATSPDFGKNIAAYYYWVYPNLMFNFYPWGLSLNIVKPISLTQTRVSFLVFIWDESKYDQGAGSNLDKVEMEDEEIVENVQMGIRSSAYQHGRYSVTREQGTHHFHRLLAADLNG